MFSISHFNAWFGVPISTLYANKGNFMYFEMSRGGLSDYNMLTAQNISNAQEMLI